MELTSFLFDPTIITNGMDVIRTMKTLAKISTDESKFLSPAEFSKKYDAGEFNKK